MERFVTSMYRNIRRNALFSCINFTGLVFGFICVIVIAFWIKGELSYDRFQKNNDAIYRVHRYFYDSNGTQNLHMPNVAPVIAPLLKQDFSEIQYITRVLHTQMVFSNNGKKVQENKVCFAEPEVIKIFTFEGLSDQNKLLASPFTVIISEDAAFKYFHMHDGSGKTLEFKDEQGRKYVLNVTGTFKTWTKNSHFNPDFFISFSTLETLVGEKELKDWNSNNYETFVLLSQSSGIDKKLDTFIDRYLKDGTLWTKIRFEKLTDIHFNWFVNRSYIYILSSIAFLILIVAGINYMNLTTAMYYKRLKELKIRKILGASTIQILVLLLCESILFCFAALVIAICLITVISASINSIFDQPIDFELLNNSGFYCGIVVLSILTGVISGFSPILMLSSINPANKIENVKLGGHRFHGGLVVIQFFVTSVMIISFLFVSKQLNYLHQKDLGLNKEHIVVIPVTPMLVQKLDVFKQELTQNPNISAVSASKRVPADGLWDSSDAKIFSNEKVIPLGFRLSNIRVDDQFIATYQIKLLAGRNFSIRNTAKKEYIINESAVKQIGWKSSELAIGQVIEYGGTKANVVGVVNDFYYESLHHSISPLIMFCDQNQYNLISIRINAVDPMKAIAFIENTWSKYNISDEIFHYEYVNDRYNRLYHTESILQTLIRYFMILAISIAVLGLIGLSVFLLECRTKEIGIRKVNGAQSFELLLLLNKDIFKWVILAFAMSCPIAWIVMHQWMQKFAYKTQLSWWVFLVAGCIVFLITIITVSWQSWQAAMRNPVEALRSE